MLVLWISLGVFCGLILLTLATVVWSYRWVWMDGYAKVLFADEMKHIHVRLLRVLGESKFDASFNGKPETYRIDKNYIYTTGRFNQRIMCYVVGDLEPKSLLEIDPREDKPNRSALEFNKVARNRVAEQTIDAFDDGILTPVMGMMLVGVILLIAIVGAAWYVVDTLKVTPQ